LNILYELKSTLRELLGDDDRPIVVFSSAWPFFRAIGRANSGVVEELLQVVMGAVDKRSLLMPAFSGGYREGTCDLDITPSTTGSISEAFRQQQGNIRTLSAFFSFSVQGLAVDEVSDLMPADAWGDDSIYHWMELQNARFLMLGTDPTHCSFLHRIEWLLRDVIPYRYVKAFDGILRRDKKDILCREHLFVRCLKPEAENDFTVLKGVLETAGMVTTAVQGVPLALYDAHQVLSSVLPAMKRDPLLTVINKYDFKRP
jgi:aminoglycoside N3'-acetyltransferase